MEALPLAIVIWTVVGTAVWIRVVEMAGGVSVTVTVVVGAAHAKPSSERITKSQRAIVVVEEEGEEGRDVLDEGRRADLDVIEIELFLETQTTFLRVQKTLSTSPKER